MIPAGTRPGQPGHVSGGLVVPARTRTPPFGRAGENVAGRGEIRGVRCGRSPPEWWRRGRGRDAGCHAGACVDGFREGGSRLGSVLAGHGPMRICSMRSSFMARQTSASVLGP